MCPVNAEAKDIVITSMLSVTGDCQLNDCEVQRNLI